MELCLQYLTKIDSFIWGLPLIIFLMSVGIYLSVRLNFLQIFNLKRALRLTIKAENEGQGDVSSFKSLCVALAATIGTGSIVGVATAIKMGGPGAIFWMCIAGFFGMATKYAEGVLAIRYRSIDKNGEIAGGPMYYIKNGMGEKYNFLAIFFAIATILVACLGIGTFPQVNAISDSLSITFEIPKIVTCIVLSGIVGTIIFGGLKNISVVASKLIPFMAFIYFLSAIFIIFNNHQNILPAINLIINNAFTGSAAAGGFVGSTVLVAIQSGIARGIFSNEAGLGSAPIVSAAAKTNYAAEQGLISMIGVFVTIIICIMTGLIIVTTNVWRGDLNGALMVSDAFVSNMGYFGNIVLAISLVLFAFTTILGWNYYGERACVYLFGVKSIKIYRVIFIALIALGVFLKLDLIWILADIVNGLMAIPNLIALLFLSGVVIRETKLYFRRIKKGK